MKVRELIDFLTGLDQDADVLAWDLRDAQEGEQGCADSDGYIFKAGPVDDVVPWEADGGLITVYIISASGGHKWNAPPTQD
jgi:hypothetical protein